MTSTQNSPQTLLFRALRRRPLLIALALILLAGAAVIAQDGSRPLYALPDARTTVVSSSSIALTRAGRTLVMTNMLNNTVSIVETIQRDLLAEIPVGRDPRSVSITPDDSRAVVTNRGDGTLSVIDLATRTVTATYPVGELPYAVAANSNDKAYISLQASSTIVEIDLANGAVLRQIDTPPFPGGLALWGDFLYVTHLWSGDLSLIYLPDGQLVRSIATGPQTSLSQSIEIDPAAGIAYLPQTRSLAQNPAPTYDSVLLPVVNRVDLRSLKPLREGRIGLDTADRPVNMPFAARLDPVRRWLYVVNAGSNDLSVIDLNTGLARGHLRVGANPRGLALSRDNAAVFVHNAIDGTLTFIETRSLTVLDILPVSNITIPADVLIGTQLFHDATDSRLTANRLISCANCHFDGFSDGRVWQGANTPLLFGLLESAPYGWLAQWGNAYDVEAHLRQIQVGTGLVDSLVSLTGDDSLAGQSLDLDALVSYLAAIPDPLDPVENPAAETRGAELFAELECGVCHQNIVGSDGLMHDVGTGGEINTPALRYLGFSAPYFHDGSAAALEDVFRLPGAHQLAVKVPEADIAALMEYLLGLR